MENQEKIEELIRNYQEYAQKNGFKLNPDKNVVEKLVAGLLANEAKDGAKYCPCRRITGNREEDNRKICPCQWHRKEIREHGSCFCGLFVYDKEKESAEELLEREKRRGERDLQRMERNDPFN